MTFYDESIDSLIKQFSAEVKVGLSEVAEEEKKTI